MTTHWHFTSPMHLAAIEADGMLKTTESNIGAPPQLLQVYPGTALRHVGEHVGPDVVWLFDTPTPTLKDGGHMLRSGVDKRLVRIKLELPPEDVAWWPEWSNTQGIDRVWYQTLARFGRPAEWHVVERAIPRSEFVRVEVRTDVDAEWVELAGA